MENILTIDVETWNDRLTFRNQYSFSKSHSDQNFLEGMKNIISLLDRYGHTATFFFLGSTAKRYPNLVSLVHSRGHEIASHGYSHTPLDELSEDQFRKEIKNTHSILENITNVDCIGYRAPRFSLTSKTSWAIDILKDCNYRYDSSIYPVNIGIYGLNNAPLYPYNIDSSTLSQRSSKSDFMEFPVGIIKSGKFRFPLKMRYMGYTLTQKAIRNYNTSKSVINLYLHPWELGPKVKMQSMSLKNLFRNFNIPFLKIYNRILSRSHFTSIKNHILNKD